MRKAIHKNRRAGGGNTPPPAKYGASRRLRPPVRMAGTSVGDGSQLSWLPPVIPLAHDPVMKYLLARVEERFPDFPGPVLLLVWGYMSRVLTANQRLEAADKLAAAQLEERTAQVQAERMQLASEILEHRACLSAIEADASERAAEFAGAVAAARIPWRGEAEVSAGAVEEALVADVPEVDEVAGEHQMIPPARDHSAAWRFWNNFSDYFGPPVCGAFIAFCVGGLVGLVSKDDLQKGEGWPVFAIAASLGTVFVHKVGCLAEEAARSLARCLEVRQATRDGSVEPPVGREWGAAIAWLLLAAGFTAVEMVAEAYGVRQAHLMTIAELSRAGADAGSAFPFAVYKSQVAVAMRNQ